MLIRTIFLLYFSLVFSSPYTNGQNLVPNSGFEDFLKESKGQSMMENVAHWFNVNQNQNTSLFGTPDHMFAARREDGQRRNIGYFEPFRGKSSAGLISYMQRVSNYREYIGVKFTEPLKPGNTYEVSFYVSNGNHATFGNIGTSGLGAYLSKNQVAQKRYEPLPHKPQFILKEVLYLTEWKKITFDLVAKDAYRYLTIGNFFKDSQIKKKYFSYDVDPQSYVYIDEVVVRVKKEEEEATPPTEPESQVVSQTVANSPEDPTESREVHVQGIIPLGSGDITIKIWDEREMDGDVVSLQFNGKWLLKNYLLEKKKKKINIRFEKGKKNQLIFYAHTLGDVPPNTTAIQIKSGKVKRELHIRSDMEYCGAIQFKY